MSSHDYISIVRRSTAIVILALGLSGARTVAQTPDLLPAPTFGADLNFGLSFFPTYGGPGSSIRFRGWLVRNTGAADAGAFSVTVFFSTDANIDPSDYPVGTTTISGLTAGSMTVPFPFIDANLSSTIPVGTYYVMLKVDDGNAVTESDETNNVLIAPHHFQVLGALNVDLLFAASPVLSAGNPNEPIVPGTGTTAVAQEGALFITTLLIRNAGAESSPESMAAIFLSRYSTMTTGDTYLRSMSIPSIPAGSTLAASITALTLPAIGPGDYFLRITLDSQNQIIEAANSNAESNNTATVPFRILPGPSDETSLWRVQVVLKTASIVDANTDDDMLLQLNRQNWTWMDYGRNDFEKGDSWSYDMVLRDVSKFRDIQEVSITKTDTDGWCSRGIELWVNGRKVFSRDFSPCRWLDNPSTPIIVINYADLRNSSDWQSYADPSVASLLSISHEDITSIIEATVGDAIRGKGLYWGHLHGKAVELSKASDHQISVDLDLAAALPGLDPEIDLDFIITIGCECGAIEMTASDPTVEIGRDWVQEIATGGLYEVLHHVIVNSFNEEISKNLAGLSVSRNLGVGFCPSNNVKSNADVEFGFATGGPELSVSSAASPSSLFRPGDTVTIISTVRNNGQADSAEISEDVYFDRSPVEPIPGLRVGESTRPAIPMCGTAEWSDTYLLPTTLECNIPPQSRADGRGSAFGAYRGYTLTIRLNVTDSDPGDNISIVPIKISNVDLVAPEAPQMLSPYIVRAGHSIDLAARSVFGNKGAFASGPVTYGFALFLLGQPIGIPVASGSSGWPLILSSVHVDRLHGGESLLWGARPLVVPSGVPIGRYKLVAFIQGEHGTSECSLTNNTQSLDISVLP